MTDTATTNWDEIDIDETVTEADQKAAENFDADRQPGVFLCEVVESNAIEKNFKEYSCYAAELKMKVHKVLELNQPILDDEGKTIERDGQIIASLRPVPEDQKDTFDALYVGSILTDEITLHHRKEKPGTKNRRIYVAQRLTLIDANSKEMNSKLWSQAPGKYVIVKTEWNYWEDKSGEKKRNVRVGYRGYDYASKAVMDSGQDAVTTAPGDGSAALNDEEFDI